VHILLLAAHRIEGGNRGWDIINSSLHNRAADLVTEAKQGINITLEQYNDPNLSEVAKAQIATLIEENRSLAAKNAGLEKQVRAKNEAIRRKGDVIRDIRGQAEMAIRNRDEQIARLTNEECMNIRVHKNALQRVGVERDNLAEELRNKINQLDKLESANARLIDDLMRVDERCQHVEEVATETIEGLSEHIEQLEAKYHELERSKGVSERILVILPPFSQN
jgi:hypothetical protein